MVAFGGFGDSTGEGILNGLEAVNLGGIPMLRKRALQ